MLTAGDLVPMIKQLASSYIEEIGNDDTTQNASIFMFLTHALRRLARIAYQERTSDALYISSDGDAIFQRSAADITDIYAPLRIIDPQGRETQRRVSYADTRGWWRESTNTNINLKGFALATNPLPPGEYTLHYLAYPASVNSSNSPIQFPDAGSMGLCYYVAGLILESRPNAKDLVTHYMNLAQGHLKIAEQANIDGRGTSSGGFVPSLNTVDMAFGG